MFYYDGSLRLSTADLVVDSRKRHARGFISHAHHDHMARHQKIFCTPETALFCRYFYKKADITELPYFQPMQWGGVQLTTYPAGHCLGSAMLLVEDQGTKLLYSGDFKLGPSFTAKQAELPQADIFILETTFGEPEFVFPSLEESAKELIELVRDSFRNKKTPIVHAYSLGKSQEATKALTDQKIPVVLPKRPFEITKLYEQAGVSMGNYYPYQGKCPPGYAMIVPPKIHRTQLYRTEHEPFEIALTGWAAQSDICSRWKVDHAIQWSDHAGYQDLLNSIQQVNPQHLFCTHGPKVSEFVERMKAEGYRASVLEEQKKVYRPEEMLS